LVCSEMAARNLGEPNGHCVGFTAHSVGLGQRTYYKFSMGSETGTMATRFTQIPCRHLPRHKWPVPSTLHNTLRSNRFGKSI
jgi:hypothetical protein